MSKKSMSRFAVPRHLSASEGRRPVSLQEVLSMRMVRRLAVIGAIFVAGLVGAGPALAESTSISRTSAAVAAARNAPVAVIADPAGPTTTIAPAPVVDVTPTSEGMPGANLVKQLLSWLAQLALWGSLASI